MRDPAHGRDAHATGKRMGAWGALCVVWGLLLLVSPVLLGKGELIKYMLAVGFLSTCLGTIFLLLGLFDWWRGRASALIAIMVMLAASLASVTSPASGAIEVSLPLGPHYRVGKYLPVHVRGSIRDVTIGGDGIIPTMVSSRAGELVVPVLVIGGNARELRVTTSQQPDPLLIEIRELAPDRQLIGIVREPRVDVSAFIPPAESIVRVQLDRSLIRIAPPIAFEMLQALVVDDPALIDTTSGDWLAADVQLLLAGARPPDERWPWIEPQGVSVLALRPIGPASSILAEAGYLPVSAWNPGTAAALRRQVVLAAVLFCIAAVASALLRSRLALVALLLVTIGAAVAMALWSRATSPLRQLGGDIAVDHRLAAQWDRWTYFTSARPGARATMSFLGAQRAILVDAQHAATIELRLRWGDDQAERYFQFTLPAHARIGFLSRVFRPEMPAMIPAPPSATNPWAPLARALYAHEGYAIAGEVELHDGPLVLVVRQP
jgi:hypothetical protein